MLTFALVIAYILIASLNLSYLTKYSITDSLPFSIFFAMFWTTLFGVAGHLLLGAVLLLPVTLLIALLLSINKSDFLTSERIQEVFNLPIIFFVTIAAWTFKHTQYWKFSEWDEFTHWGLVVKAMDYFNVLGPASPTYVNSSEYPPGLATISYLIVKIGKEFDEADVLWAYQLLFVALLIPVLNKFNWRQFPTFVISFLILIFSSVIFYNTFQTIYADPMLAILFGFSLFITTSSNFIKNKFAFVYLLLLIIAMMLVKDIAIFFVFIPVVLYVLNKIYADLENQIRLKLIVFRSLIRLGFSSGIIFLTRLTWTIFVAKNSSGNVAETEFSKATSQLSFGGLSLLPNYYETKYTFLTRVLNGGPLEITHQDKIVLTGFKFNTYEWLLVITLMMIFLIYTQSNLRLKIKTGLESLVIISGAIGYLFILFLIYLIVYSGANQRSLISYDRYVSTYLSGALFYLAAKTVVEISDFSNNLNSENFYNQVSNKSKVPILAIAFTILLIFQTKSEYVATYISKPSEFSEIRRAEFQNMANKIKLAKITPSESVWIIAQHTMGFEFYLLQYEVFPANVGKIPYSIGSPAFYGDPWTDTNMTVEKWNSELKNYDYVIVYKSTDSFKAEFGSLFEDPNSLDDQGIYRVVHDENGNRLIKYI